MTIFAYFSFSSMFLHLSKSNIVVRIDSTFPENCVFNTSGNKFSVCHALFRIIPVPILIS